MTNSIEQINAEIAALAAKKTELENLAKVQTQEQKDAAIKAARNKKDLEKFTIRENHLNKIGDILKTSQPSWKIEVVGKINDVSGWNRVYNGIRINGRETWLDFAERYTGNKWRREVVGVDIKLNSKRWQDRKGKGYDYAAIAEALIADEIAKLEAEKLEAIRISNKSNVEKVMAEIEGNTQNYYAFNYSFRSSAIADKPIFVDIKISRAMTEEKAIRLGKFLRAEGLL